MEFGLTITTNDRPDMDPRERVDSHLERAVCARDCGFRTIAVGHRYSFGPATDDARGEALETWRYQPLLLLAYLAAHLGSDVSYATAVLVSTGQHPVRLAEDIATLDAFCAGGLRVGIGLGWLPYELEAFDVERSSQVRRFEELLILTSRLLTEDSVTFDGEFFRVDRARLIARAVQQPRPPIWVGASADAAVRRAARLGDTWSMSGHTPVRELVRQQGLYRAELAGLGRPLPDERPINRVVYIAEDRKTAFENALPNFVEQYRKRGAVGWFQTRDDMERALAEGEMHWIVGDPDDCYEQLRQIETSVGANLSIFTMPQRTSRETWQRTIRLLGDEVLPKFQAPPGAADPNLDASEPSGA